MTPATLPATFVVLAEAAKNPGGGHDARFGKKLAAALKFVEPVLTEKNLMERNDSLDDAALDYIKAEGFSTKRSIDEDCAPVIKAVEIGLVAGFLLSRMLDDKVGAAR